MTPIFGLTEGGRKRTGTISGSAPDGDLRPRADLSLPVDRRSRVDQRPCARGGGSLRPRRRPDHEPPRGGGHRGDRPGDPGRPRERPRRSARADLLYGAWLRGPSSARSGWPFTTSCATSSAGHSICHTPRPTPSSCRTPLPTTRRPCPPRWPGSPRRSAIPMHRGRSGPCPAARGADVPARARDGRGRPRSSGRPRRQRAVLEPPADRARGDRRAPPAGVRRCAAALLTQPRTPIDPPAGENHDGRASWSRRDHRRGLCRGHPSPYERPRRAAQRRPDMRMLGAADETALLGPFCEALGIAPRTKSEILADPAVQVVYVHSKSYAMADLTIEALEAGKAVLCEKPAGRDAADVRRIVDAVERTGGSVQVGYCWRFSPAVEAMQEALRSGRLGKVLQVGRTAAAPQRGRHRPHEAARRHRRGDVRDLVPSLRSGDPPLRHAALGERPDRGSRARWARPRARTRLGPS